MTWRLAKSLDVLRKQINAAFPGRSKSSDGTVGDSAHASRLSDHNPWVKDGKTGVVTALDITHDPAHGIDSEKLAEALRRSRDPRIKYILSNKKIASSTATDGKSAWAWRKYTGKNPHNKHVHLSVKASKALYDSTKPWAAVDAIRESPSDVSAALRQTPEREEDAPASPATNHGGIPAGGDPDVFLVQSRLKTMGFNPGGLDGLWGGNTAGAIAGFLNDNPGNPPFAAPVSEAEFRKVLPQLNVELKRAEGKGFTRPIAEERSNPTDKKLAETAPEIVPVKRSFWGALWASIVAAFWAAVNLASDAIASVWNFITGYKDNLPEGEVAWTYAGEAWKLVSAIPGSVWLVFVALGFGALAFLSFRGKQGITGAVQKGDRL